MYNEMPKILKILLLFFASIICLILINIFLPPQFIMIYFPFGILYRVYLSLFLLIVSVLVFLKANKLYTQTGDSKLMIIAGGFLAGTLLQIQQLAVLTGFITYNTSEILYYLLGKFWALCLFLTIFFLGKEIKTNLKKYIYLAFVLYAITIMILDILLPLYAFDFTYKVMLNIPLAKIIEQTFYLFTALIYTDIRLLDKNKKFSYFTFGLYILGLIPLIFILQYSSTIYIFASPLINIVGFIFIYLGLNELPLITSSLNLRQKLSVYFSIFLIVSYLVFVPGLSIFLGIALPISVSLFFLGFITLVTIIQYMLAFKFTFPITNIIESIEKTEPKTKPLAIPVISKDEIGLLTEKINETRSLNWTYTQVLIELNKKEKTLRKVIESVRSEIDINITKNKIVTELGAYFKADRCFFIEYDENEKTIPINQSSEYLPDKNDKSMAGVNFETEYGFQYWTDLFKLSKKELYYENVNKYFEENKLEDSLQKKYADDLNFASGIGYPIFKEDKLKGLLVINYKNPDKEFTEEELDFVKSLLNQIEIAINQSELYKKLEEKLKHEVLIRDFILKSRQINKTEELKKFIVNYIGNAFNADRCFLIEYDQSTLKYKKINPEYEYRSSEDIKSITEINKSDYIFEHFEKIQKIDDEIFFSNLDEYLKSNNLNGTLHEKHHKCYEVQSNIGLPLKYADTIFGRIVIHSKEPEIINEESIEFARLLIGQASLVLYQAVLFESLQIKAEKEKLLRTIIETIRSTINVNEIKNKFVYSVGKLFDCDRCFISYFNHEKDFFEPVDKDSEYTSSNEVKSTIGEDLEQYKFYTDQLRKKNEIIVQNAEEFSEKYNLSNMPFVDYLKENSVKSGIGFPILYGNHLIGIFSVQFTRDYHSFIESELEFLRILSDQAGIAINQAKLYETTKKQEEMQNAILNNIPFWAWLKDKDGKYIGINKKYADAVYLKPEDVIGKTDFDIYPAELAQVYRDNDLYVMRTGEQITVEEEISEYGKRMVAESFKSPVYDEKGNIVATAGVCRDITERKEAQEKILKYTKERDAILNNIPFWAWMKDKDGKYIAINEKYADAVYLKPEDVIGKTDFDIYPAELAQVYRDNDLYVMNTGEQITVEEEISEYGKRMVAESFKSPVYDEKGNIVATAGVCRDITERKEAEEKILKYTQELLQTQTLITNNAEKERILREIISEIKISSDLNQAYNILLMKISNIFSIGRVLFLESDPTEKDALFVKYEFINKNADMKVNNLKFPKICVDAFLALIHNLETLIINDVSECYPDETSTKFFEKYKIKAILAIPFVKYNKKTRILGFIVLCSDEKRVWTPEEISLLKSIGESIVSVIWEITKLIEIEELRNSFVLTLAHDFQVPLVGERRALEYLLKIPQEQPISKYKEIIEETIKNNISISALLVKLVDIYNYEAGKKQLNLTLRNLFEPIIETTHSLQNFADLKGIRFNTVINTNVPKVYFDLEEIKRVIYTLTENAVVHSKQGSSVDINVYKEKQEVIIKITDNGSGIPLDVQERLFKRYEMAVAIERKIGSGVSLYLAKQIIEAHNGKIWFESKIGKGTSFYFSLPV